MSRKNWETSVLLYNKVAGSRLQARNFVQKILKCMCFFVTFALFFISLCTEHSWTIASYWSNQIQPNRCRVLWLHSCCKCSKGPPSIFFNTSSLRFYNRIWTKLRLQEHGIWINILIELPRHVILKRKWKVRNTFLNFKNCYTSRDFWKF